MNKRLILIQIALFVSIFIKAQYGTGVKIELVLRTDTTSMGQKIEYPDFANEEVTMAKVTIPPGKSTGWHKHNFPVFAYILKGNLTVEFENNRCILFAENSCFAEVINTFHNGTNKGNTDVVLLAIYLGEKGEKLSKIKEGN